MPFHLAELQHDDCLAFAIVDEAATVNWPLARAMEQGKASRREMIAEWFHASYGKDPSVKWMKAVDSETGEMAAAAVWRFSWMASPKSGDDAGKKGQQAKDGHEALPPVFTEMGRRWNGFQERFIGDRPFANLQVLVSHPKYQRQGAGSMLIKYGCDVADAKGVLCALGASEAGYSLYTRHGFAVVETSEMDLRPYGVEASELGRRMIRAAREKEESKADW